MLEYAIKSGEKNKLVPLWLRLLFILPCFGGAIFWMIYWSGTFDYIADIQISWFNGYYVIITTLLTAVVYLLILLISLLPAILLIRITRTFYEKKQNTESVQQTNKRSQYQ